MSAPPSSRRALPSGRLVVTGTAAVVVAGLGSIAALYLTGFHRDRLLGPASYEDFQAPGGSPTNQPPVYWSQSTSSIRLPSTGWRPLRVRMELRAPPEAPRDGVPVAISVDDARLGRIVAGHSWEERVVEIPPVASATHVSLQFHSRTFGEQRRGVGVRHVRVDSTLSVRGAAWAASTGLAMALGLVLVVARHGGSAVLGLNGIRRSLLGAFFFAAGAVVLGIGTFGGTVSLFTMSRILAAAILETSNLIVLMVLLVLPGWSVVATIWRRRAETDPEIAALLCVPVTLAMLAGLLIPLQVAGATPGAFTVAVGALYAMSAVATLGVAGRRRGTVQMLDAAHPVLILPLFVAAAAIFYLSVGVDSLEAISSWTHVSRRHLHRLPIDNHLSWLASETWQRHLEPNALAVSIWRIGDRGPLLAAVHSLLTRALEPAPTYGWYLRLGILLNALFAGGLFVWFSRVTGRRALSWWLAALVALNPWFFLNVYYTWPKLLGAHLVLAALLAIWSARSPDRLDYAIAGGLFGLGALAHPGALLSLPLLCLAVDRSRGALGRWLAFAGVLAVVMAPWMTYKRLYSPETYNLFITHYLDAKGFGQPIGETIARFFSEHPPDQQLAHRWSNLVDLWWRRVDWRAIAGFWTGRDAGGHLYAPEFFWPWHSTGILWFVLIPIGWCLAVARRDRSLDWQAPRGYTRRARPTVVAGVVGASLSLHAVLRWAPPNSHELPYLELLMLAGCGLLLIARLGTALLGVATFAVIARQWYYFEESARISTLRLPPMDSNGALFWLSCGALLFAAILLRNDAATLQGRAAGIA
jgi:hypothetical protein